MALESNKTTPYFLTALLSQIHPSIVKILPPAFSCPFWPLPPTVYFEYLLSIDSWKSLLNRGLTLRYLSHGGCYSDLGTRLWRMLATFNLNKTSFKVYLPKFNIFLTLFYSEHFVKGVIYVLVKGHVLLFLFISYNLFYLYSNKNNYSILYFLIVFLVVCWIFNTRIKNTHQLFHVKSLNSFDKDKIINLIKVCLKIISHCCVTFSTKYFFIYFVLGIN